MDNQTTETVQNYARFVPNSRMRKWVQVSISYKDMSPSVISRISGIHRNTFYYWLRIDGFRNWWNYQQEDIYSEFFYSMMQIGLKRAAKSYKYWRSMMELLGIFKPKDKK